MSTITAPRRTGNPVRHLVERLAERLAGIDPAQAPFLAAIARTPTDRLPRLVFADWLDDHGEPESAEYVRLVCDVWEGIDLNRQFLGHNGGAGRLRECGPDGTRELNRIARANDRECSRLRLADWFRRAGFAERAAFIRLQILNENRTPTPEQENREYDLLLAVWREWLPREVTLLKGTADKKAACGEGGWGGSRLRIPSRAITGDRVTGPAIWFLFEKGLPVTCWCDQTDHARIRESLRFRFPWLEFKRVKGDRGYFDPWIDTSCDGNF